MPIFQDLADEPEDDRIKKIGEEVAKRGRAVAFMTDDEPGKAERYIAKLLKWFPGVRVIGRFSGPVAGVITVKVGPTTGGKNYGINN